MIECEAVFLFLGTEEALKTVFHVLCLKGERTAEASSLPRRMAASFIAFAVGGQTVEHRLQKGGKGAFSPSVFCVQKVESFIKIKGAVRKTTEIYNLATD